MKINQDTQNGGIILKLDSFEFDIVREALNHYKEELDNEESEVYYFLKDNNLEKWTESCNRMLEEMTSLEERSY